MSEAEIASRLEKLECENRRLKRFGGAALMILVALGAIYATQPIPEVVRAHAFEVIDNSGIVRASLDVSPDGVSVIAVHDARGIERAWMMSVGSSGASGMGLADAQANVRTGISENGVALYDSKGSQRVRVGVNEAGVPYISLSDRQGFGLQVGGTGTSNATTGATQQTSAASIIMFGNDKNHHVIWMAP